MRKPIDKIRWIASYPKSGNTWVRCFIEAYITDNLNINHMYTSLPDIDLHDYQSIAEFDISKLLPLDVVWFRNAVLFNKLMRTRENLPTIMKTHMANISFYDIPLIPPQLTHSAIYLVRDPRAIAVSMSRHNNVSIDKTIYDMNDANSFLSHNGAIGHLISTWSENVETWLDTKFPTLVLRYEDLKADTENSFKKILEVLELDYDETKFNNALKLSSMNNLKKQEEKERFRESQKNDKFFGSSNPWETELSDTQIKMIELVHYEYMEKFGYLGDSNGSI